MNLKNNKGYTGIDISIAMIIILIFIPTIFGIVYNLQATRSKSERETDSLKIATDILDIAKTFNYSEISISESSPFKEKLDSRYVETSYNSSIDDNPAYLYYTHTGVNNVRYRIQIDISNYYPSGLPVQERYDLIKKINVKVTYPLNNTTKSIEIGTVLQNK